MPKVDPRHRRFCEVLMAESAGRRTPWWASIDRIAERLGLSYEEAIVLADDCEKAGLVQHDLSHTGKAARLTTDLPHSVTLASEGWRLLRKPLAGAGEKKEPAPHRRAGR
jgi:hypothetical protein